MSYNITIWKNSDKEIIQAEEGKNLLDLLNENNYNINAYCGGEGICGKCRVKLISGNHDLTKAEKDLLTEEDINKGIRLACMVDISDNLEIEIEDTEEIVIMTSGNYQKYEINHEFNKKCISLKTPTINDQRDYTKRLFDKLDVDQISYNVLQKFDKIDKEEKFTLTYRDNKIISIEEGNKEKDLYGIAVDIGTTTIVLYLFDLNKGKEIDNFSIYNPQKKFGADVISRINYSQKNEKGKENLQAELIKGLNKGIENLADKNHFNKKDIFSMSIAGNTIMLHTLLRVSAKTIAKAPYIPIFSDRMDLSPADLGINININGVIRLIPCVSGYVGADIVADLLTINEYLSDNTNLMIDIGTNGEIVLNKNEKIFTCSTAAGPAFEGANISFGMAGIPGAVSEFKFNNKQDYKTIGNKKAAGICGSGLVDIIAELLREGIIDKQGGFVDEDEIDEKYRDSLSTYKDLKAFRVVEGTETKNGNDIYLTQKDIRKVQLAKGAIQAGIEILKKESEVTSDDIDNVFIAGGFGNYINPHSACVLNLIPSELEEKIIQIGNAAGTGAKICLLNKNAMKITDKIIKNVSYIELSKRQDFTEKYMDSMPFA